MGVAGEGRVVGLPKFHSWGKCTGEDLYCAHVCRSHGSELLPIQDRRRDFKNSLKNNLSSYL